MWKSILGFLLLGLGLITTLFFRHYRGDLIPHPFLFWLGGIAMMVIGGAMLVYTGSSDDDKATKQFRQAIDELKKNGEKIIVDLARCEIKDHGTTELGDKTLKDDAWSSSAYKRDAAAFQALTNDIGASSDRESSQSVVLFSYENKRTGEMEKFISQVIPKDGITLSFYFDRQKQTSIYVDKSNRKRYFFDLDFLNA